MGKNRENLGMPAQQGDRQKMDERLAVQFTRRTIKRLKDGPSGLLQMEEEDCLSN